MNQLTLSAVLLMLCAHVPVAMGELTLVSESDTQAVLNDASAVIAEDSLPRSAMRIGRTAEGGVRDDDTLDGSVAVFQATDRNWVVQWHWDESQLMPGLEYDAYARIKVRRDARGLPAIQAGVYDDAQRNHSIAPSSLNLTHVRDDQWALVRIGAIVPAQAQFIWMCGDTPESSGDASRVFFDRFILVPQLQGQDVRSVLDARRPDSSLVGFSIDIMREGRFVMELDGAPDITLDLYAILGRRGQVRVAASRWNGESFTDPAPITSWASGASSRSVRCELGTLFAGARRTQVEVQVSSDGDRAVLFGAIASPDREALPIRATWSSPPGGSGGHDVVTMDERTRELASRAQFAAIVEALRQKLPGAPVAVRSESATRKVYRTPDTSEPRHDWLTDEHVHRVRIAAAGNEYESFQLVLIPLTGHQVDHTTVTAGSWTGPGPLPPLRINPVGYVEAKPLGYSVGRSGWTPDPLMPDGPVTLPADEFQPIWCTVFVPKHTPAGVYRTHVAVTLPAADHSDQSTTLSVPVELEVWDFTLPDQTHLRTSFWFNRGYLKLFYGVKDEDLDWETVKQWLGMHLDHRVTPIDNVFTRDARSYIRTYREPDGAITFDFTEQDRLLSYLLDERNATCFNIAPIHNAYEWYDRWPVIDRATGQETILAAGHRDDAGRPHGPWRIDDRYRQFMTHYLSVYWAHLQKKGWADRAYHNMFDEPRHASTELIELVEISRASAPGCPVLTTAPWGFFPEGVIDIHVPLTNVYDASTAASRRQMGEETWWYTCSTPKHPHANFFLEYPAVDTRILPWLSWKYGAQGLLYWATNDWAGGPYCENVGHDDPADRWPSRPWIANPYRPVNGEGYLLYPGPGMKPLASIRLVNLREGIEDYEYLWLLKEASQQLAQRLPHASAQDARETRSLLDEASSILAVNPEVAHSMTRYTDDPTRFDVERRRISDLLIRIRARLAAE